MRQMVFWLMMLASAGALAAAPDTRPLGLTQLQNAAYWGIEDIEGTVQLQEGHWEGDPAFPGSASVPRVDFLGDLVARGDLDGDGRNEAVVILTSNFGGTGVLHYVAVVAQEGDSSRNVATIAAGDRIQVRALRIEEDRVLLDLVRAGPNDGACCPTEVTTLSYGFDGGRLTDPVQVGESNKLTPEVLAGQRWRLAAWKYGEPVEGHLTLAYADGRWVGNAGCNDHSASVKTVSDFGSIEVGQPLSTRKQCEPDVMSAEQRFLGLLPRVTRFWYLAGQLALDYRSGDEFGVMYLEREQ
jgi:heat shock protein HslJ